MVRLDALTTDPAEPSATPATRTNTHSWEAKRARASSSLLFFTRKMDKMGPNVSLWQDKGTDRDCAPRVKPTTLCNWRQRASRLLRFAPNAHQRMATLWACAPLHTLHMHFAVLPSLCCLPPAQRVLLPSVCYHQGTSPAPFESTLEVEVRDAVIEVRWGHVLRRVLSDPGILCRSILLHSDGRACSLFDCRCAFSGQLALRPLIVSDKAGQAGRRGAPASRSQRHQQLFGATVPILRATDNE